jgi:hypothetical protein
MKITVITDKAGKIVGTAHHGIKGSGGAGDGGPVAGPKQKVHVIDLPGEPEENAAKLHSRIQSRLGSGGRAQKPRKVSTRR